MSEDFEGCIRLKNKKQENIAFLDVPEINLNKLYWSINPEDSLNLFYLVFLLDHLLKIRKEKFLQRKKRWCIQKFLKQAWE